MSITKDFEKKLERIGDYWSWEWAYKQDDVDELLAHARALEAMLKKHELVKENIDADGVCWDYCPECREYFPIGKGVHKISCQLAKLLEGVEEQPEEKL